jgi:hypothetical protein
MKNFPIPEPVEKNERKIAVNPSVQGLIQCLKPMSGLSLSL